jgi:transmembrane sensor
VSKASEHTRTVALEAVEWLLDLQAGTASMEQRAAFADWLRRSPVHVEEFLRVVTLQADLGRLAKLVHTDVDALIDEVSHAPTRRNVIDLRRPGHSADTLAANETGVREAAAPTGKRRGFRTDRVRSGIIAGAAAAAALIIGFLVVGRSWLDGLLRTTHYTTGTGEQRSVNLRDGSEVQINVRSDLMVRVDASSRDIRLAHGEALFHVAKDPRHPFRVHTPDAVIEAKGTQFDVRVRDGRTVVVLLEGHVAVSHPISDGRGFRRSGLAALDAITLDPGQMVTVESRMDTALRPRRADVAAATAWLQHRLVFDDTPLSQVIEEFNRYSSEQVILDDPSVGDVRITASFAASSAPLFARSVAAAGDLRVTRGPDGTWHIGNR